MKSDKKPRIPRKIKKEVKKRVLSVSSGKINPKKLRVYVVFRGKHTFFFMKHG